MVATDKSPSRMETESTDVHALVATNVRILRRRRGLSQGDLASRAGVPVNLIEAAESGAERFQTASLAAIAEVLRVPVADFFATPSSQVVH